MKAVLVNDTSDNGHFGCRLVGSAYRQLCERHDIELIGTQYRHDPLDMSMLDKADLVLVNAEGCIHDGKYEHLLGIGSQYPAVLMNGSYSNFSKDFHSQLRAFKLVTVRECLSNTYMSVDQGIKCLTLPDLIFSHTIPKVYTSRDVFITDSAAHRKYPKTQGVKNPYFVRDFSQHRRAVCGRFHAIALAAMLDMPFSAYPSNTWKNEGLMIDMGVPERYYALPKDALMGCPDNRSLAVRRYVRTARRAIDTLFERLHTL